MTVYVDDMFLYPMGRYRRMKMSHIIADTEQELHDIAAKIGVARKWHQGDHYDICLEMRIKAVNAGAIEITMRQCAAMSFMRKITGSLPSPEKSEKLLKEYYQSKKSGDANGYKENTQGPSPCKT